MKYLLTVLIMVTAINTQAAGMASRVKYWNYMIAGDTNTTEVAEIVTLTDHSDGQGTRFKWKIQNPPTKAQLTALDDATVEAWAKSESDSAKADYEVWSDKEKAMLKLLIKEINILRVKAGVPVRTPAQVKNALKAELN